jgi:hypothetical protein
MVGREELARLLSAAENAAPVDAVDAVTREVGLRLNATGVSFLVADTSGRALVRLTHVRLDPGHASRSVRGAEGAPVAFSGRSRSWGAGLRWRLAR